MRSSPPRFRTMPKKMPLRFMFPEPVLDKIHHPTIIDTLLIESV
jgi:hypothetical protein